jgi:thioredoxin reductase
MRAMHVAHNAAQLSSTVTIYTNDDASLSSSMSAAASKRPQKFKVDNRKIIKLVKSPAGSDVIVHFEDGTEKTEGFLVHTPFTEVNGPFAKQLGCELTPAGDYKTTNMLGETTVPGVYAAGDCATIMKAITTAMYLGSMVAAGLAAALEIEME